MATQRRASATRKAASTSTTRSRKAAPSNRTRKEAPSKTSKAPARKSSTADVTVYATKDPTDYHKAFARWIKTVVGYDANGASSKMMAFLMGVSIATAARPAFMASDFLEEYRERSGMAKRGPKPKDETPSRGRRKAEPVEEIDEDDQDEEFEDDEEEFEEDDSDEDEDFEDDEDSDEEDEDSEEFDEDDDEDEEPEPAPKSRGRQSSGHSSGRTQSRGSAKPPAKKAAPAKGRRSKSKDDDFLF